MYAERVREALLGLRERIEEALSRAGRTDSVTIVAITKGHPAAAALAALDAGLQDCGENRVQELADKVEAVGRQRARWHLVGHLQRNKVRRALPLFDLIHSIDSVRLARELSAEAERAGVVVHGLIEVNTSGEATKGGFAEAEVPERAAEIASLPGLRLEGLMTMAPFTEDETVIRRTFARARELFDRCGREVPGFDARHLSLGMSHDFALAVEEGSTMVRVGTVLFGERRV